MTTTTKGERKSTLSTKFSLFSKKNLSLTLIFVLLISALTVFSFVPFAYSSQVYSSEFFIDETTLSYFSGGVSPTDTLYNHNLVSNGVYGNSFYADNQTYATNGRWFNSTRINSFPNVSTTKDAILGVWFMPLPTYVNTWAMIRWRSPVGNSEMTLQISSSMGAWIVTFEWSDTTDGTHSSSTYVSLTNNNWYWLELRQWYNSVSYNLNLYVNGSIQSGGWTLGSSFDLKSSLDTLDIGLVGSGVNLATGVYKFSYITLSDFEQFPPTPPTLPTSTYLISGLQNDTSILDEMRFEQINPKYPPIIPPLNNRNKVLNAQRSLSANLANGTIFGNLESWNNTLFNASTLTNIVNQNLGGTPYCYGFELSFFFNISSINNLISLNFTSNTNSFGIQLTPISIENVLYIVYHFGPQYTVVGASVQQFFNNFNDSGFQIGLNKTYFMQYIFLYNNSLGIVSSELNCYEQTNVYDLNGIQTETQYTVIAKDVVSTGLPYTGYTYIFSPFSLTTDYLNLTIQNLTGTNYNLTNVNFDIPILFTFSFLPVPITILTVNYDLFINTQTIHSISPLNPNTIAIQFYQMQNSTPYIFSGTLDTRNGNIKVLATNKFNYYSEAQIKTSTQTQFFGNPYYSEAYSGNITNGIFSFGFNEPICYLSLAVLMNTTTNTNWYVATYYYYFEFNVPTSAYYQPIPTTDISVVMLGENFVLFIFLFITPILILGLTLHKYKKGKWGIIIGAVIGLGFGITLGFLPIWAVFIFAGIITFYSYMKLKGVVFRA